MSDCMKCKYVSKEPYQEPCNRCKSNVSMSIDRFEPMTQGDKIRAMSDEELAKFLTKTRCYLNVLNENVVVYRAEKVSENLEWLQSEVKEN